MSFLQSLARSFIRSTVSQVGRDVGRMVSNQTLRGRHATPHTYIPRDEAIPPRRSRPAPEPPAQPAPTPLPPQAAPAQRIGNPELWLTNLERGVLHQAGAHLLDGYDRAKADQGHPSTHRTLTEDELYGYAVQLAANSDGQIDAGEIDLSIQLTGEALGEPSSADAEHTLRHVSGLLKDDFARGMHPMVVFRRNLLRVSPDTRLNAIRLMAKVILQDGRLENQEKLWLFEVLGYAGVRIEDL